MLSQALTEHICSVSAAVALVIEFIFKVMNRDEVGVWGTCLVLMMFKNNKDGMKCATCIAFSVTGSEEHSYKIILSFRRKSKKQICFPL